MKDLWSTEFLGNTLTTWVTALAIVVAGFAIVYVLKKFLLKKLIVWSQKTKGTFDDFAVSIFKKNVIPFLYFLVVYTGISSLTIPVKAGNILHKAMMIVMTLLILMIIIKMLQYFVLAFLQKQEDGDVKQRQSKGLLIIVKAVIWILGIVFLLDNLGYNVSTIIAGLGIGGIAIALAAQTILGDLFSYFVIIFDRPFEIGDFIIVDDKMGVVEYIGIKTTRLRTLGGEQLVCSNKDLTDSRVHNYKRMEQRRVVFTIGVTYQTSADTLKRVPQIVKDIIAKQADVRYDRGNFSGFGDSSLNFEFVYYVLSSDYNLYMDRQQTIYFDIFRMFEKNNIQFAYPTTTVFLNSDAVPANMTTN
ncbi:MAG TPA: mechanosensitive ion channel family protein [Chitinophagaceae bacterium]|nr:mechanosensitive ion channel family protein [Chitinophagaceae bacterium]